LDQKMTLLDLYPDVRSAHIALVVISGALFFARGMAVMAGAPWAMQPAVRRMSVLVDTALLGAALLLLYMLQLNPFGVGWLSTKIGLLFVYIILGSFALKRARTPQVRLACFVAALLCLGLMVSVAVAHSALGFFVWL
jgi:uncharacterized membrane protein SirB2